MCFSAFDEAAPSFTFEITESLRACGNNCTLDETIINLVIMSSYRLGFKTPSGNVVIIHPAGIRTSQHSRIVFETPFFVRLLRRVVRP
jgi:ABC-type uncharacterized transport system auxiliary subunit